MDASHQHRRVGQASDSVDLLRTQKQEIAGHDIDCTAVVFEADMAFNALHSDPARTSGTLRPDEVSADGYGGPLTPQWRRSRPASGANATSKVMVFRHPAAASTAVG